MILSDLFENIYLAYLEQETVYAAYSREEYLQLNIELKNYVIKRLD